MPNIPPPGWPAGPTPAPVAAATQPDPDPGTAVRVVSATRAG